MAVTDLCSGDGWFTLQIANLARHVVAIDIDENLLDVARVRAKRFRAPDTKSASEIAGGCDAIGKGSWSMKDEKQLRQALVEHLEGALGISDELHESSVGYLIECALDQVRAGDIDRLRGEHR